MTLLAFLLAGVAVWNFIVGMWIMGVILVVFALLAFAESLTEDDYFW